MLGGERQRRQRDERRRNSIIREPIADEGTQPALGDGSAIRRQPTGIAERGDIFGALGIEVKAIGAHKQVTLFDPDAEPLRFEQVDQDAEPPFGGRAGTVMHFHRDLLNLRPVVIVYPGKHIQLGAL
ncbi:MAG: hypothetical protein P8Y58_08720, partial [Novosphingobium sp.]